ncbi:response regulator [Mucilaginibacter sp.]|uniref:response regulator n=1 Tax=Mucilaginibacter sp. TaxID=1882438 RepID=UPI0025D5B531|nr:response regulator [Mucilaginibacter sp.]
MDLAFIVIDESELDCFIARKVIQQVDENLIVYVFQSAQHGLDSIRENRISGGFTTIILLDLQMPVMDGFQFVEEFEKLPAEIRNKYKICVLSCTRNASDISRIMAHKTVVSLIEKPLYKADLQALITRLA